MVTKAEIELRNRRAIEAARLPKDASWNDIWNVAKECPFYGVVDIQVGPGITFAVLSMNDDAMAIQYFWTDGGLTEPKSFEVWERLARSAGYILDVGSYTGFYSLIAACVSKARIVAYEPVSFIYARLAVNVMLNGFSRVRFENRAIAKENGTLNIGIGFGPKLFSSGSTLTEEGSGRAISQPCAVSSLDSAHRDDPVDLIKIDVEGAELDVLKGGASLLQGRRPVLLLETRSSTHTAVEDLLQSLGYHLALVENSGGASNYLCWHDCSHLAAQAAACAAL